MTPFLFVTDLDNTFVGDDSALEQLSQQLSEHRQEYGSKIVYATGRSLHLYKELAQEKSLISPDVLVASVGTEIYLNLAQSTFDSEWAKILSVGWDREKIIATGDRYADLVMQPVSEQNEYKVSYFVDEQTVAAILPQLRSELSSQGLQIKFIYSGSQDLDLIPEKGDKGLAVQFLRQKWGIEADRTVVCGDSGNDIALFRGEERGIIVGNAKPELHQWYRDNQTDYRYLAEASYAAGILEGLEYFGFLS